MTTNKWCYNLFNSHSWTEYGNESIKRDDLNEDFLEGLKTSFKHKEIEIVVHERDETGYLLRSPANREHLLEAVSDIEQNRNLIVPDQEQFG